jgi:flagellar motor protein MotB
VSVSDSGEPSGPGTPPWLISFGDMMTLFLCFFIILVTMAPKQDAGLVAAGIGEFVNVLEGSGVGGALDGNARMEKVNEFRQRFGLEPLTLAEYLAGNPETKSSPNLEKLVQDALCDYSELSQPSIVEFAPGSAVLSAEAVKQVDVLASVLNPAKGQLLVLEGFSGRDSTLAAQRALAVRQRFVDEWHFLTTRVEARGTAPANDRDESSPSTRRVDARLIEPHPPKEQS